MANAEKNQSETTRELSLCMDKLLLAYFKSLGVTEEPANISEYLNKKIESSDNQQFRDDYSEKSQHLPPAPAVVLTPIKKATRPPLFPW